MLQVIEVVFQLFPGVLDGGAVGKVHLRQPVMPGLTPIAVRKTEYAGAASPRTPAARPGPTNDISRAARSSLWNLVDAQLADPASDPGDPPIVIRRHVGPLCASASTRMERNSAGEERSFRPRAFG